MQKKEVLYDVSAELERDFGPKGSESRKMAEDKAWEEYNAQILLDVTALMKHIENQEREPKSWSKSKPTANSQHVKTIAFCLLPFA